MATGTESQSERNEALIAAVQRAETAKLRAYTKRGCYCKIVVEYVIQDGIMQIGEVTVKEQIKV
jgi:hypothetical protein